MGEYKRIISYLYSYENGNKKTNVGYARVETKNLECKITIHVRLTSVVSPLKAYMFYRDENKGNMVHIFLTNLTVVNGVAECKVITSTSDVMDSGFNFSKMSGIMVYSSLEKFYATEWDGKPIHLSHFEEYYETKSSSRLTFIPYVADKIEEETIIEPVKEVIEAKQEEEKSTITENVEKIKSAVKEVIVRNVRPQEESPPFQLVEEQLAVASVKEEKETIAERIFKKFPSMYPFEDNEIASCVKMDPQDIGMLPMDCWVLGNNSFLMQGYYNHRHLIFAKVVNNQKEVFYLGVPGVFSQKDQNIARMFGFTNFKTLKNKNTVVGEYGYWMKQINIASPTT